MWPFESTAQVLSRRHVVDRNLLIEKASLLERHEDLQGAILSSDIVALVEGIKKGDWTSTIVVRVYIHSAIKAHRLTNCLTEVNFDAALQRAAELDDAFASTGQLVGPLHGLPFSLKDQFNLAGKHTTIGFTEWILRGKATTDCAIAQIARHHGAIPICKTNVPQTMLSFECRNPLWERTLNPYNVKHTPGGSSGGEGALLACDGAAFGFGSDIGGSLRIPMHYCGLYALKPSSGRSLPSGGQTDLSDGARHFDVTLAPITRNAADLQLLTALFYNTLNPPTDSAITTREVQRRFGADNRVETPLRPAWFNPIEAASTRSPARRKLRVGYYYCDGMTRTSPACIRAVEMSKTALEGIKDTEGAPAIEKVEIDPALLQTAHALEIFCGVTSASGYMNLRRHLGSDWKDPSLYLVFLPAMSRVLRGLIFFLARFILRDRIMAAIVKAIGPKSTTTFYTWMYKLKQFNEGFEERIWERFDLDSIICPVQAVPAMTHSGTTQLSGLAGSTIIYNVIDVPVTVLPVTRVDPVLDSHLPTSPDYKKWMATRGFETCSSMMATETYKLYNATTWKGLPVGIQIVCQRSQEELSIGMMTLLDKALGPRGFGPGAKKQVKAA
ncbi:hypothetical protein CBS101457_005143 [Exobasidium rhododendri]|nr:hypothetical protein CBS101457_005143 [Exobasidium rhododendri]